MTTLRIAVSGQGQNCSGNLEISPGIGTLGNFSGKQKKSQHGRKCYFTFLFRLNLGKLGIKSSINANNQTARAVPRLAVYTNQSYAMNSKNFRECIPTILEDDPLKFPGQIKLSIVLPKQRLLELSSPPVKKALV